MLFIDNNNITDPHINLALEEYVLRNIESDETFLLFYINEPSIIIGKNQNTLEEINHEYVRERNIHVVRRISGGGAVYHDLGNLNFSFITNYDSKHFNNYKEFTAPVIKVLNGLGAGAELGGRNDILIDGKKISGNAQFTSKNRMFSHGTLLFSSDIDEVVNALNVKIGKIESKGIKSIRSRVANIADYIANKSITIEQFRIKILEGIFGNNNTIPKLELTKEDWENVYKLADEKYRTWEWNFGESPEFNLQKTKRFISGEIDIRLNVVKGVINNVKIFGDFQGEKDVLEIEKVLINIKYDYDELKHVLNEVRVEDFFGNITNDEFLSFIY